VFVLFSIRKSTNLAGAAKEAKHQLAGIKPDRLILHFLKPVSKELLQNRSVDQIKIQLCEMMKEKLQ
jgi:hypothetical protein